MIFFAIYIFQANIDQDEDFGAACEKTTELGAKNASGNNIWKETESTNIFPCLLSGYRWWSEERVCWGIHLAHDQVLLLDWWKLHIRRAASYLVVQQAMKKFVSHPHHRAKLESQLQ